jgi:hypothetical protein
LDFDEAAHDEIAVNSPTMVSQTRPAIIPARKPLTLAEQQKKQCPRLVGQASGTLEWHDGGTVTQGFKP